MESMKTYSQAFLYTSLFQTRVSLRCERLRGVKKLQERTGHMVARGMTGL